MPRGKGWFWTVERLEELIDIMKKTSDTPDSSTGTFTFRGNMGLSTRLVAPYDKVDDTVTISMIGTGVQLLQELDMLEPRRLGTLPSSYERGFTPRAVTDEMVAHLKEWKAAQR